MSDGSIIKSVKNIIKSDARRRYVVVSAPGKRYFSDKKVTDLLLACHDLLLKEGTSKNGFAPVCTRFVSIVKELHVNLDIASLLDQTERRIEEERSMDFTASRGEYLCAQIVAAALGARFIDAERVIFFDKDGLLDEDKTYKAIKAACADGQLTVFPGFYGLSAEGKVKTFPRGGSDVTGAIVARAVHATLYENWTDVSGFYACDPQIVDNPQIIKRLSYNQLHELSRMGAGVVHCDSVYYVRQANIPIQIKNTFRPQDEGTFVLPNEYCVTTPVIAIVGKSNFIASNISLISIVSLNNNFSADVCARVFSAIAAVNVNAKSIRSDKTALTIGVSDDDYEKCIRAIYSEFYKK